LGVSAGIFTGTLTGGPVTSRSPNEVPHREQSYSWSSPDGSTNSNFSRTGWELRHLGQYNSLAMKSPNCWDMLNLRYMAQNIVKDLGRGLGGIDFMHNFLAVKIQNWFGFVLVRFEAMPDNVQIGIVKPVFTKCAPLEAFHQFVHVGAAQIKYGADIQGIPQHFRLMGAAWNAVEDEGVGVRIKPPGLDAIFDELLPEFDCRFIGNEFAAAGIFQEYTANGTFGREIAKHITAGTMKEIGNHAQDFALGPFARSRSAKQKCRAILHSF
jgi:hypothetical protein